MSSAWINSVRIVALSLFCSLTLPALAAKPKTITFPSEDGLEITADLYLHHKSRKAPLIVLCHQAGWSRGEYVEIAPKLNSLGFNCLAIDQRSGGTVNNVQNQTAKRAAAESKPTTYLDARPDIVAALKYARKNLTRGPLIAWGSSYSSALVLEIVGRNPKLADGVLSFAPGEYFTRFGKSGNWIAEGASQLKCPVFITSARNEAGQWSKIYDGIGSEKKTKFVPKSDGQHGSRALWERFPDSKEYWSAVILFLAQFQKTEKKAK